MGAEDGVVRAPELPAELRRRYDLEFRSIPDVVRVNAVRFGDDEAIAFAPVFRWTLRRWPLVVHRSVRWRAAEKVRDEVPLRARELEHLSIVENHHAATRKCRDGLRCSWYRDGVRVEATVWVHVGTAGMGGR